MAAVDAYAPCPCGSGQKYKRCCQKAEAYVDRAERLDRNGQHEAAVAVVNEGLAKHPDAAWLHIRKAVALAALEQPEKAVAALAVLIKQQPGHLGAIALSLRLLLELGDFAAAVDQFQTALALADDQARPQLAPLAGLLGGVLPERGLVAAGIKHLELGRSLIGDDDSWLDTTLSRARSNPSASAWVKNPYRLSKPPEGLSDEARRRYDEALGWADRGLWRQAAAAFELLSADRETGLCRLWLGDHPGAVEALRRSVRGQAARPTTDAVDLEALCQTIDDRVGDDPIEEVELSWPIRDRAGLLARLAADPRCVEIPDDEEDDDDDRRGREVGEFLLLDRPKVAESRPDFKPSDMPMVLGRVVVGDDAVALQTRDDGRLDKAVDGFTTTADKTIPPAQPRTRVVGSISRADQVLDVACFPPADLEPAAREKLIAALLSERICTVWPETPMPYLAGKTPVQAAGAGGFEAPLRAALALFEESAREWEARPDLATLRGRLNVPAEPAIDHASVVVDELPLGRLGLLDPKRLDDDRLLALYQRTRTWGLAETSIGAARELTTRRKLLEGGRLPIFSVYGELAMNDALHRRRDPAMEWARKGRAVDPQIRVPASAASWDMLELQVRMATEQPDVWVPELVVVMNRYERDRDATRLVLSRLVQAGLIRPYPSEDEPGGVALDATLLQQLIARFGPRVQTPSGEVGVSAVRSGIWTPGGGTSGATGERPRIILPGQ